jgi:hypothetical protein
VAFRSRPRPSSTLDAKASTICPYYLDGDQGRAPKSSAGDTRCHPRLSSTGGCGNCAVFKGRSRGLLWPAGGRLWRCRAHVRTGGPPVSQNSTARTRPNGRRDADRRALGVSPTARDRRDAGRAGPGSVDVLGRTVGGRRSPPRGREPRGPGPADERELAVEAGSSDGAVPYGHRSGAP